MSSTPILDREQPTAPAKRVDRRSLIIGVAFGVVIGLSVTADGGHSMYTEFLPYFVLWFIVAVILHEIGHVIAGTIAGLEFRRFVAGPFMLSREATGYRFRFLPKRLLSGGQAVMIPPGSADLRRRFLIFISGGPLATALLFLPVVLFYHWYPMKPLLVVNSLLAAFSWAPLIVRGHATDAKTLLVLARPGPQSDRLVAMLYLITLDAQGVPPRDWPPDIAANLRSPVGDPVLRVSAGALAYIHARDFGDPADCAATLEAVLSLAGQMTPDNRRAYFAEAAYFHAAIMKNPELARSWLDDARKVKGALPQPNWDACTLAAIAAAEGNAAEAKVQVAHALEYLDSLPGKSGSVASARARVLKLPEIAAGLHAPGPPNGDSGSQQGQHNHSAGAA